MFVINKMIHIFNLFMIFQVKIKFKMVISKCQSKKYDQTGHTNPMHFKF